MVLKGVNWAHNEKIRSYGLERSQLGTQCKNQVIWVLKEVSWVHNAKIRPYGHEKSRNQRVNFDTCVLSHCRISL